MSLPSRFPSEIPLDLTDRGDVPPPRSAAEERTQARDFFAGIRTLLEE